MDDQELLEAYVCDRSPDAMSRLVTRYINLVYSAALRQTKDPHVAEDVTQTTFIALTRHARRLTSERALSAWLLVTTRNAALDAAKAKARRLRHEREAAQMAPISQEPCEDSQWEQIAPHLDSALASLSANDQRAITLSYFEGCTSKELAERLGVSLDTARQRVHRATERLRDYFARQGIEVTAAAIGPAIVSHAVHAAPTALAAATANALAAHIGSTVAGASLTKATGIAVTAYHAKAAIVGISAILLLGVTTAAVKHYARPDGGPVVKVLGASATPIAPPQATESSTVIGYARTPDGKPVVGAEVMVSTPHHYVRLMPGSTWKGGVPVPPFLEKGKISVKETLSYGTINDRNWMPAKSVTGWQGLTGSDGRFELHLNQPAAGVIVRSKQGIGLALASDLATSGQVTVNPWARLEGDLHEGSRPLPKTTVIIEYVSDPEKLMRENLIFEGGAMTDDAGHFVIPQATPGSTWLLRQGILTGKQANGRGGETEFMTWPPGHTEPKFVELAAGQTTHISLGGVGRAITGHVATKLDAYTFRRATVSPRPASGPGRPIHFNCAMDISADGTFKAEDFPPGQYHLHIEVGTFKEPRPTYACMDYIAHADTDFEIPTSKESRNDVPFNLGEFKLITYPHLMIGKPVPNVTGKLADGSFIHLSDLRGKYVLLEIGALAPEADGGEEGEMLAIRDHFMVDLHLAMLSINSQSPTRTPTDQDRIAGASWPHALVGNVQKDLAAEYQNSGSPLYLIGPDGNLLAMNLDYFSVYNVLDQIVRTVHK